MNQKLIYKYGIPFHFEVTTYPDGQHNVKLDMDYWNDRKVPVDIECSIRDWTEMEILLCLIGALKQVDFVIDKVNFWYLFGLRSDRAFEAGMPNYVRDVISPIIKSIGESCNQVGVFMPHGRTRSMLPAIRLPINAETFPKDLFNTIYIAADESALQVIHPDPNITDYRTPFFHKKRTDNGIEVSMRQDLIEMLKASDRPILLADDLCDGGATFIAEADYLTNLFPDRVLYLFVQHALFSKGLDEVANKFNRIYVTNSYQEIDHPKYHVIKVI